MIDAIQSLVANGHPWSSIKQYTLSEVGAFFRSIIISERERKTEVLTQIWMGNNLDYKGLQEVLDGMGSSKSVRGNVSDEKSNDRGEWDRLKAFMGGKT